MPPRRGRTLLSRTPSKNMQDENRAPQEAEEEAWCTEKGAQEARAREVEEGAKEAEKRLGARGSGDRACE